MKKRLLSILLLVVSFMMFDIDVHADAKMVARCNGRINLRTGYFDWDWTEISVDAVYDFVRFTDNDGNAFYAPISTHIGLFNTVPDILWDGEELDLKNQFDNNICPQIMERTLYGDYELTGKKEMSGSILIEKPRYIIYEMYSPSREQKCQEIKSGTNESLYNEICKRLLIAEGYNSYGAFSFVGPDLESIVRDEVFSHQIKLISNEKIGYNYFKIDENIDTLIGKNYTVDKLYDNWYERFVDFLTPYKDYQVKILYASSGEGKKSLQNVVDKWLSENKGPLLGYNDITNIIDDEDFVEECTNISENIKEGKKYTVSKNEIPNMLTKLEEAQKALKKAYEVDFIDCGTGYKTSATSSVTSCVVYSETLDINEIIELAYKENDEHIMNSGFIIEALYDDVSDSLKTSLEINNDKINAIDASSNLNDYTEKFYTVIAYLRSIANKPSSELKEYKEQINQIYDEYEKMVEEEELHIYPVVDCETLLGADLVEKINSYLNIFKIAVPIILIGFGIIDFTKAVFAGEEEMKKAQQKFIKRLFIALLIFLIPTVVNLILSLANKVWPIISTDSCRLY